MLQESASSSGKKIGGKRKWKLRFMHWRKKKSKAQPAHIDDHGESVCDMDCCIVCDSINTVLVAQIQATYCTCL